MNVAGRSLLIVALMCGLVQGAPASDSSKSDAQVKIVNQYNNKKGVGFEYAYELSDGRYVGQDGYIREQPDGSKVLAMKGSYSFIGPDGFKYTVDYYADETGYHPIIRVGEAHTTEPPIGFIDPKVLASLIGG